MSQKKTVTKRRSGAQIKRAKADNKERRVAYRQAKEGFELAERVRQARERLGITQAELASRIGSTQPAIARLEAGGSTPSLDTLRRIAAALDLELVVELRARRVAA
jgi:ribosome-binding protein aMBF1 (putative translation factor)